MAKTYERIIDALTELVLEGGLPEFSVQEVADRAGVSVRTVYRYFPTRESLLQGLVTHVRELLASRGGRDYQPDWGLDELCEGIIRKFAAFDEIADSMEASLSFAEGARLTVEGRQRRTEAVRAVVATVLEGHDEQEIEVMSALVRILVSSRVWLGFRDTSDIDGRQAGVAAAWAVQTLMKAAREGEGPQVLAPSPAEPELRPQSA